MRITRIGLRETRENAHEFLRYLHEGEELTFHQIIIFCNFFWGATRLDVGKEDVEDVIAVPLISSWENLRKKVQVS